MKHSDAFKVRGPMAGERVGPFVIACSLCDCAVITLHADRPYREIAVVVKSHLCPQLKKALITPKVLLGQTTLAAEFGMCNSVYRPANSKHVVLCEGAHSLDSETHGGGGYVWHDREAENYA